MPKLLKPKTLTLEDQIKEEADKLKDFGIDEQTRIVLAASETHERMQYLTEHKGDFGLDALLIDGIYTNDPYILHLKQGQSSEVKYGSNEVLSPPVKAITNATDTWAETKELTVIWDHGKSGRKNPKGLYVSLPGSYKNVYVKIAYMFHTGETEYMVQDIDASSIAALGWELDANKSLNYLNKSYLEFKRVDSDDCQESLCYKINPNLLNEKTRKLGMK